MRVKIFFMTNSVSFATLGVVMLREVLIPDRAELGVCAVLELGHPLMYPVVRSSQLHYSQAQI